MTKEEFRKLNKPEIKQFKLLCTGRVGNVRYYFKDMVYLDFYKNGNMDRMACGIFPCEQLEPIYQEKDKVED